VTIPHESQIDYERLYEFRFRNVSQAHRQRTWDVIAPYVHKVMGSPVRVLDPAAGRCEFVNALPGVERWVVDVVDHAEDRDPMVKMVLADVFQAELPGEYFDGVFVSNFLEHLEGQEDVARFLAKMRSVMTADGTIALMGPNYRYCSKSYFDEADHKVALSHVSVTEHLYATGFETTRVVPRFLPYSLRSSLPNAPSLVEMYLRLPLAWRVFGKQFLVIARPA
jgi:Methyltransferase domain